MRTSVVIPLLLLFAATPFAAHADDREDATRVFNEGRELLKRGAQAAACARFRESFALDARVGTLLNIATCEEHEGHLLLAARDWERAIALARETQDARADYATERAQSVARRIPKLTPRLAPGMPEDTVVLLDGVPLLASSLATAIPLDPGEHVISASAPHRGETRMRVTLIEGEERAIAIELEPLLTPTALAPAPLPKAVATETAPPPRAPANAWMRPAGYAAGALGLISLGVGAYFGIEAVQKTNDSNAGDHCNGKQCDAIGLPIRQEAVRAATVATVAFVTGAVAVAGGITLLVLAPRASRSPQIAVVARPSSLSVVGRF